VEFEGLLHANNATKVISLAMHRTCPCCPPPICLCYPPVLIPPHAKIREISPSPTAVQAQHSPSTTQKGVIALMQRPRAIRAHSEHVQKVGLPPVQYSIVEFETWLAGYSDDEFNNASSSSGASPWMMLGGSTPRLLATEPDVGKRRHIRIRLLPPVPPYTGYPSTQCLRRMRSTPSQMNSSSEVR
jgi:hypothetical protein